MDKLLSFPSKINFLRKSQESASNSTQEMMAETPVETPQMRLSHPHLPLKHCPDIWGMDPRVYYGVQVDWEHSSPAEYSRLLGRIPAVFGSFVNIGKTFRREWMLGHLDRLDKVWSEYRVDNNDVAVKPIYVVSVLPYDGLESITDSAIQDLADCCVDANRRGISVMARWAHEMNGEWYPWGKKPDLYVHTWRRAHRILKTSCPGVALIWSPNIHDNRLDYEPYYPGNEYVDWVGLSFYHFGNSWPYTNDLPHSKTFESGITGATHPNIHRDRTYNFYQTYCVERGKPFALTETAAPLHLKTKFTGSATEFKMKQLWWRQIYGEETFKKFPQLKMIIWFEYNKVEDDGMKNDHRLVSRGDRAMLETFKKELPWNRMVFNDNRQLQ